jgi:hypothetical protein
MPAKWSAYRTPSVIVVFVVLVCKPRPQKPQEAFNASVTEERSWALYMPLYTFIHNLLNVLVQIANIYIYLQSVPIHISLWCAGSGNRITTHKIEQHRKVVIAAFSFPQSQWFLQKVDRRLLIRTSCAERSGKHSEVTRAQVTDSVTEMAGVE